MAATAAILVGAMVWTDAQRPDLEVDITVRPFRYVIDTETTLSALQQKQGVRSSTSKGTTLGAVRTNVHYYVRASTTLTGRRELRILVGYRPATVFIANEMTWEKCSYKHVLEHESEHVRIFEEEVGHWKAELTRLTQAPAVQNFDAAQLQYAAERWIRDLDRRVHARHAQLDNPAEYAKNLTACGGNIVRLAQGLKPVAVPQVALQPVTIVGKALRKGRVAGSGAASKQAASTAAL